MMLRPFSTLAVGILIGYFGVPFVLRFAKR
jgi:hypothetical protein